MIKIFLFVSSQLLIVIGLTLNNFNPISRLLIIIGDSILSLLILYYINKETNSNNNRRPINNMRSISTYKLPCELCIGYDDGKYRCLCNDTLCETILNGKGERRIYTISEGVLNIIIPAIRKDPEYMRDLPMRYFTIIIDLAYGFTGDNWQACTDMFNLFRSIGYGVDVSGVEE